MRKATGYGDADGDGKGFSDGWMFVVVFYTNKWANIPGLWHLSDEVQKMSFCCGPNSLLLYIGLHCRN